MASDPLYRADAAVGENDREGVPEVVFYQVKHRFVDQERSIPEETADILYYTLAVGHHTGIIDCSEERLRCSLDLYRQVCAALSEGEGRYKLEAVLRGGEVYIDKFKAPSVEAAVRAAMEEVQEPERLTDGVSDQGSSEGTRDLGNDSETLVEEALGLDGGPYRVEDAKIWLRVFAQMLDAMKLNPAAAITGRRRGL